MPENLEQILDLVIAGTIFIIVLSLWIGGVAAWAMRRTARSEQVQRRLGTEQQDSDSGRTLHLWHDGQRTSISAPANSRRRSLLETIENQCASAGWTLGAGPVLLAVGGCTAVATAATMLFTRNIPLGLGVAIAALILFRLYMLQRIASRAALFESQLVGAMELAARSLRAGHPLPGAFQLIAEETAPPVKTIFAELCQRHGMGASLEHALRDLALSSSSSDLRLFATSVAIQMRAGGNLAELIDRLLAVTRERMRLNRRLRVLTTQTQMSKRLLVALPFLVFILFNLLNPEYMSPFYETAAGHILLGISATGLAVGSFVMHKMAILKY